jgi:uncharacterized protein YdhG (YjbR/CyaY superfamily)
VGTVDSYLAGLDESDRGALMHVLAVAMEEAPDAEQATSYGMPVLRYRGKPLLGFQAATKHLAVYPFSPAAVSAVREQLSGASLSKGTVRFTAQAPLPEQAIRDLVRARRAEIAGA